MATPVLVDEFDQELDEFKANSSDSNKIVRALAESLNSDSPFYEKLEEVSFLLFYFTPDHPLQLLVTNLSANDYVGRMAIGRVRNGHVRMGQRISVVRAEEEAPDGSVEPGRTVTLTGTVPSLTKPSPASVAQGIVGAAPEASS